MFQPHWFQVHHWQPWIMADPDLSKLGEFSYSGGLRSNVGDSPAGERGGCVEPLGPDTGGDAPYFFLSYAHMPAPMGDGATDPNLWITQLFKDLCRRVREMATDPPPRVGFMDGGI